MELQSNDQYKYLQFINDSDFLRIKDEGLTFFTVFINKQCGICDWWLKQVDQVAEKLHDLSKFTVLNCSENEDFCKRIGIPAFPISCIYNDEEEKGMVQFMDSLSQKTLIKFIVQHHRRPYTHRDNATALLEVLQDDISDKQIVVLTNKTTPAVFNYKLYKEFSEANLFIQLNVTEQDWKDYQDYKYFNQIKPELEYNILACQDGDCILFDQQYNYDNLKKWLQEQFE